MYIYYTYIYIYTHIHYIIHTVRPQRPLELPEVAEAGARRAAGDYGIWGSDSSIRDFPPIQGFPFRRGFPYEGKCPPICPPSKGFPCIRDFPL